MINIAAIPITDHNCLPIPHGKQSYQQLIAQFKQMGYSPQFVVFDRSILVDFPRFVIVDTQKHVGFTEDARLITLPTDADTLRAIKTACLPYLHDSLSDTQSPINSIDNSDNR